MADSPNLRELRLLVRRRGVLLKTCKLVFSNRDASVYLVPYAAGRRYYAGSVQVPEHEVSTTFGYRAGVELRREPKLSIHETGQVHVQAHGSKLAVVNSVPLASLRGEHMATVCLDEFDGLAPFGRAPRADGPERDFVFDIPDQLASGRFAVYINGAAPTFAASCHLTFNLVRPTLPSPLFVGVRAIPQEKLGDPGRTGVTVIAGWNPFTRPDQPLDHIYLRGV